MNQKNFYIGVKFKTSNFTPILCGFKAIWLIPVLIILIILGCSKYRKISETNEKYIHTKLKVVVTDWSKTPILSKEHLQASGIKFGFEGGRAFKMNGSYHLITLEKINEPAGVKNRIAYWESPDAINWNRKHTLFESSGDTTGSDGRASIFSPMPVFDKQSKYWYLFYTSYFSNPSKKNGWYERYAGKIIQTKSIAKGIAGFGGPYEGNKVVLTSDLSSNNWEGLQGITGFAPFQVKEGWIAVYGSAKTEEIPVTSWKLGLISSNSINGEWERMPAFNPITLPISSESPFVQKLNDSCYVGFFDEINGDENISYMTSNDGKHWMYGGSLVCLPENEHWWKEMRAPIGFIQESVGVFTMFFTGYNSSNEFASLGKLNLLIYNKK